MRRYDRSHQTSRRKLMLQEPFRRPNITQVAAEHQDELLSIQGVEGVGISEVDGNQVIMVFVSLGPDQMKRRLPRKLDGYPIVLFFSGEFVAS